MHDHAYNKMINDFYWTRGLEWFYLTPDKYSTTYFKGYK